MLKPTEISKKFIFFEKKFAKISSIWKKLQKFQVFGKNCKNFKYLEKIAKISSIWKKLQKFQVFGKNCRNLIILANVLLLLI